jgi:hypothetical protein
MVTLNGERERGREGGHVRKRGRGTEGREGGREGVGREGEGE